jgi:hypothetical protein
VRHGVIGSVHELDRREKQDVGTQNAQQVSSRLRERLSERAMLDRTDASHAPRAGCNVVGFQLILQLAASLWVLEAAGLFPGFTRWLAILQRYIAA